MTLVTGHLVLCNFWSFISELVPERSRNVFPVMCYYTTATEGGTGRQGLSNMTFLFVRYTNSRNVVPFSGAAMFHLPQASNLLFAIFQDFCHFFVFQTWWKPSDRLRGSVVLTRPVAFNTGGRAPPPFTPVTLPDTTLRHWLQTEIKEFPECLYWFLEWYIALRRFDSAATLQSPTVSEGFIGKYLLKTQQGEKFLSNCKFSRCTVVPRVFS